MNKLQNNFAFIDSQNLNLSLRDQGWALDYKKFRTYLSEKYAVSTAYMFIGYVAENQKLYRDLKNAGFICIFKPTVMGRDGVVKGNCDAELVLQAMIDFPRYDKAIIITGDGDFYCLVRHFIKQEKLAVLLIPNKNRFSALLRFHELRSFLRYMNNLQEKLSYKRKGPSGTEP